MDLTGCFIAAFVALAYQDVSSANETTPESESGRVKVEDAARSKHSASLTPKQVTASGGNKYTLYPAKSFSADFVLKRPSKSDSEIVFCAPAAFTTPDKQVDGIAVSHSKRAGKRTDAIGGAVAIIAGDLTVFDTAHGSNLKEPLLSALQKEDGCLFQQFQLVRDGAAETFKDKALFNRRSILVSKNGDFDIVESCQPITMNQLALDLISLGAQNAAYMDMGAWDEGWYRQGGAIKTIGQDKSATASQCNWLVLKVSSSGAAQVKPGGAHDWIEIKMHR